MSIETDLMAELLAECPRVIVGTSPYGVEMPCVTWQHIGGDSLRYLDNTPLDQRKPLIQINTWDDTPLKAMALIRRIEDRLCAADAFTVQPQGEPIVAHDDAEVTSGYQQTYSILGDR
ncbi:MAG: DUF3168 domain-containing protein [Comamonas sp.]|jgi:hypothetical protein|nr:DUF3168 domain-containing protein [Comamonas sp.]